MQHREQAGPTPLTKQDFEALARFRFGIRRYLRFSEDIVRRHGLTPQQYQLLLALKGFPGREWATVGELAERLQLRHHSTVELVNRAQRLKLVHRTSAPDDARVVRIGLAPDGERVLDRLSTLHRAELERAGTSLVVPAWEASRPELDDGGPRASLGAAAQILPDSSQVYSAGDAVGGTGYHAVLASSTRRRILLVLQASTTAPTAHDLANRLGLHVTTVRFHLDQLEDVALVARQPGAGHRRGRPSIRYRATHTEVGRARDELLDAFVQILADDGEPGRAQSIRAGRRWADLLPDRAGDADTAICDVLARLGFDPEPDGDSIRLRACPFREEARRHPDVVCQVHLGLAQRLAERAGEGDAGAVELVPFAEPELCLITLPRRADA